MVVVVVKLLNFQGIGGGGEGPNWLGGECRIRANSINNFHWKLGLLV